MSFHSRAHSWRSRWSWVALAAIGAVTASGCAASPLQGWANYREARTVDEAAEDDSFPSAAEVGLASTEKS